MKKFSISVLNTNLVIALFLLHILFLLFCLFFIYTLPHFVKALVDYKFWLALSFYGLSPFFFFIPYFSRVKKRLVVCLFLFSSMVFSYHIGIPIIQEEMGSIRRKALLFEIKKFFLSPKGRDSGFTYHSVSERKFRYEIPDDSDNIRVKNDFVYEELYETALERAKGVNSERYLLDIVNTLGNNIKNEDDRVAKILHFVSQAIYHDPFGQTPLAHPVVALEYGRAHCTVTNQYVLRSLLEIAGFRTRPIQLKHHSVLEVFVKGEWRFVDADMFKEIIIDGEGNFPPTEWLMKAPNYYLVDQFPVKRLHFDSQVNARGKRITGAVASYNTEDRGYPSYKFGAPIEFSPSRPRLINKNIRSNVDSDVKLIWDSVYDRDGDLEYYLVEIGSYPGGSDVSTITTKESHYTLKLPSSGNYYYRVRGIDKHIEKNEKTHYIPSEEGIIYNGVDNETNKFNNNYVDFEPSSKFSKITDFKLIQSDSTYTDLFAVDWYLGRGLRLVDLSDAYDPEGLPKRYGSQKLQKYRKVFSRPNKFQNIMFRVEVSGSSYGGSEGFPIVSFGFEGYNNLHEIRLYIDPKTDELSIRRRGENSIVFNEILKQKIEKDKKIFTVKLYKKSDKFYGGINGNSTEVELEGLPMEILYVDLLSNETDEVDYIFGDLQIF